MSDKRRGEVLRAIISDYVHSGEPVGSKVLVERYDLGVSPATIRNDMAELEESGLIYQPHTSAGRVPTDRGYRAFVNQIATLKPLSQPQRDAIQLFLTGAADLDDVVDRTVRLLAQLTQKLAVVQYPSYNRASLKHLELLLLDPHRVLLVVITDTGRVEQRLIEVAQAPSEEQVAQVGVLLNSGLDGLDSTAVRAVAESLTGTSAGLSSMSKSLIEQVSPMLVEILDGDTQQKFVMAGTANLVRQGSEFSGSIGPVLDALEEQVALLRLFQTQSAIDGVNVSIGSENRHDGLVEASVVTGTYGDVTSAPSHLGVVGPTRMDYPTTMAAVRAVASYLSQFLAR